ncbi:MAG TPA: topoisomerase IV [Clostridiaceae bacterium]|nr:topoisomerase IV [Clostridiaceae bacterium]
MSSKKRKKSDIAAPESRQAAAVTLQPITETLRENYMPYAMSVIVSRAIPEIDGFKPSHRKLLYTMYRMKLLGGARAKSADVVGQTMALNPHGDQAIYETLVRLTRGNGALIHPWIDSKGNFGRIYSRDMQYAAARYTEVRLDASAELLFAGLNRDSVDFVDNYSGTMKEPVLLPVQFPTVLVNANQGIAVGMASNICSFNLKEVCEATAALIDDADADLLKWMPAPDFSTGGRLLYDEDDMRRVYETGRGTFQLRAVFSIDKKAQRILVTEIPYTTTIEAIIEEITALAKSGKIRDLSDVRDETDLNGLSISLEYKRGVDPELLMQKLLRMTSLQSGFSANFNVLIEDTPKVLGVREIMQSWLAWRRTCVRREADHRRAELEDRLHLLNGLQLIMLDIDLAIAIIRKTEREKEVVPRLMAGFQIDERQAEFVAEIRLRQLNREVLLKRTSEISDLEKEIDSLRQLAASKRRIDRKIRGELLDIAKKYGRERKTILIDKEELKTFTKQDLIEDYNVRVYLTDEGYLKKLALTSLRTGADLKLKEGDRIRLEYEATNKTEVLFISNRANAYRLALYDVVDHKPSEFGEYTPNLLELDPGEKIEFMLPLDDRYQGHLLFCFENGKALRVPLDRYETKSNRRKLVSAYSDKSPLAYADFVGSEPYDLAFVSTNGKLAVLSTDLIPEKVTRTSQGVQMMRLSKGHEVQLVRRAASFERLKAQSFRVKKVPAAGRPVKDALLESRQLAFDDEHE